MRGLSRLLIALGSAVVPSAFRDDWTREWEAELWHYREQLARGAPLSIGSRVDLVLRSCGAVLHAVWLRKEEWSLSVILQDVRYAIRGLWHRPAFTSISLLMLALGIGASAAVFSVVHAVLLEPLPYREPDRLVQIWETNPPRNWTHALVAPANFLDWRARNRSFEAIAYYVGNDGKGPDITDATLTGAGDPDRVRGMQVSANFFSVLGTDAALGRTFTSEEEQRGQTGVIVLSDGFWRRRFAGDPTVVGRSLELDGASVRVIGVMPRRFDFPGGDIDYWVPRFFNEPLYRTMRRPHWFRTIARVAPGVTLEQARADMTRIAGELEREYPDTNTQMGVGLGALHEWFVGDNRRAILMLMGAVTLVLLIACANVASLLLARATTRRRELAIRVALGAGRVRLLRQLLTESLVLAVGGAVAGVLVALGAVEWLRRSTPAAVPRLDQAAVDGWVLVFIVAAACGTALVFGLVPAWQSVRSAPAGTLQEGSRSATGGGVTLRRVLIAAEVALSVVLLVGSGLLVRSFIQLRAVDPGIDESGGLSCKISLSQLRYAEEEKAAAFFTEVVSRLRTIPGVAAAGATVRLALEGYTWTGDLFVDGQPDVWGRELRHKAITPGLLSAVGVRLLQGRDFTAADTANGLPVVIVNQTLARQYLNGRNPIGQRLAFARPSPTTRWRTIIGVVADEKQDGLAADVKPEVYEAHTQAPVYTMSLVARGAGDPYGLLPAIRREVAAVDGSIAIYEIRTLQQVVDRSLATERFATMVLTGFAGGALLLAAIGLYGVVAFAVTSRTKEIGLRLALGASRALVLRMIVWDGLRVVLAGLAVGLLAALALSRVVSAFLFATPPTDPTVLLSVAGILALAGALASYIPALRAARVDPAVSLRE